MQQEARGDLGLDGVEEVREDGQELLERGLGATHLQVHLERELLGDGAGAEEVLDPHVAVRL